MSTKLNPYLTFRETTKEAMEFYKSVFGGELTLTTFGEAHATDDPVEKAKIMHGMLVTEGGLTLMGADIPKSMDYTPGNSVSVSLSGDNEPELRGYWEKLSERSTNATRLDKAPWGDIFGMCTDTFGVNWLVNITAAQP